MTVRILYFKIFWGTPRTILNLVCDGNSVISYIVLGTYTDIGILFWLLHLESNVHLKIKNWMHFWKSVLFVCVVTTNGISHVVMPADADSVRNLSAPGHYSIHLHQYSMCYLKRNLRKETLINKGKMNGFPL